MTLVAALLAALGAADLVRGPHLEPRPAPILRGAVAGAAMWALVVLSTAMPPVALLGAGLVPVWLLATTRWRERVPGVGVVGLLLALGAGVAVSGLVPPAAGPVAEWFGSVPAAVALGTSPERFLVLAGAVLFAVESGNVVVRAVLVDTGTVASPDEEAVKGGRVIGPIERVFLLGMALLGQYLAIGAIVTAKSILRFPEIGAAPSRSSRLLSARGRSRSRRKTAEYVLVGSLVSWAVAFGLAVVVALAP